MTTVAEAKSGRSTGKSKNGTAGRTKPRAAKKAERAAAKTKTKTPKKPRKKTPRAADKHALYQDSVQNPEFEIAFFQRVYKKFHGTPAKRLREDFCGTAFLSSEWVKNGGEALGVDLDGPTLDWGREHNIAPLGEKAENLELLMADVRDGHKHAFKPDLVAALNFSYFVFKTRADMRTYFDSVYKSLPKGGVFLVDMYGGPEAQKSQVEATENEGFDYEWDQHTYNPITGEVTCYIHFEIKNGRRMRRAFSYDWRLWSMPEIRDILEEVGFTKHDIYWEGTDKETGDGNGIYRLSNKGDDAEAWVAYIACRK